VRRLLQSRSRVRALRPAFALSVAAVILLLTTLGAATPVQQSHSEESPAKAPDDPDTPLFQSLCHNCHDAANILSRRRTMAEWEDIITKMIEKGLKSEDKDLETVFAYLNRNYGKVFINRAPADEIVAVLTISQKDADAIISYRKAGGSFTDFDSLRRCRAST
jgi:cytochrome c5